MIDDSPTPHGQEHLSDACLWLVGAPLTVLDTLYLTRLAPPIDAEHPETLIVWALGVAALLLLSWSLLSSACAHLVLLRATPPILRRIARALVSRYGTKLSRTLLARAGAGALIGSAPALRWRRRMRRRRTSPSQGSRSRGQIAHAPHRNQRRQTQPACPLPNLRRTLLPRPRPPRPNRSRSPPAIPSGRLPHPCAPAQTMLPSMRRGARSTRRTRALSRIRTLSTPDRNSPFPRTYHEHANRTTASYGRNTPASREHEAYALPPTPASPLPLESGRGTPPRHFPLRRIREHPSPRTARPSRSRPVGCNARTRGRRSRHGSTPGTAAATLAPARALWGAGIRAPVPLRTRHTSRPRAHLSDRRGHHRGGRHYCYRRPHVRSRPAPGGVPRTLDDDGAGARLTHQRGPPAGSANG